MAKVSLYINDDTWKRFRAQVFTRHGTLRRLSDEVEGLMTSEDIERIIVSGVKKAGISVDQEVTSSKIKKTRPKLRGVAAEIILKDMRNQRYGRRVPRQ